MIRTAIRCFHSLGKHCASLGDQAVNNEEFVYILCQMLFILFYFFLRHEKDLEMDPRCRAHRSL